MKKETIEEQIDRIFEEDAKAHLKVLEEGFEPFVGSPVRIDFFNQPERLNPETPKGDAIV